MDVFFYPQNSDEPYDLQFETASSFTAFIIRNDLTVTINFNETDDYWYVYETELEE